VTPRGHARHQSSPCWSAHLSPSGVSGSGSSYGGFDGNLVSELDHNNPVADCDIQTSQVDTYTYDGSTASGVPHQTTTSTYDSYGRQTSQTVTINNGGATALVSRYKEFVRERVRPGEQQMRKEIEEVMLELHKQGQDPKAWEIGKLLKRPGVLRNPKARAIIAETKRAIASTL
jgi:YD repeat-containing protein